MRKYTKKDENYILKNYGKMTTKKIANLLGVSPKAVQKKYKRLIERSKAKAIQKVKDTPIVKKDESKTVMERYNQANVARLLKVKSEIVSVLMKYDCSEDDAERVFNDIV